MLVAASAYRPLSANTIGRCINYTFIPTQYANLLTATHDVIDRHNTILLYIWRHTHNKYKMHASSCTRLNCDIAYHTQLPDCNVRSATRYQYSTVFLSHLIADRIVRRANCRYIGYADNFSVFALKGRLCYIFSVSELRYRIPENVTYVIQLFEMYM